MNYNAVLAKKDGSYIPIRHDFDTHIGFVQDFTREQKEAIQNGIFQIVVGDLIVDIEDISHIQPIYEEEEEKVEQGGTKGMQLYGEGFMAEGDPYELAVFAKNLGADEIRMSDCCEGEADCCDGCDCESVCCDDTECCIGDKHEFTLDGNGNAKFTGLTDISPYAWGTDVGKVKDHAVIVLQLPYGDNFEVRSSNLVKHVQSQYGNDIKVVVLPSDVQVIDTNL